MYHYIRNTETTPFPDIKALSIADFERQLDWLQAHVRVIDYPAFEAMLYKGSPSAEDTALLTFDDGFIDHYETVMPILQERRLTGVFFVSDSTIGERPTLLNVHKTHFLLARLGAERFRSEIEAILDMVDSQIMLDRQYRRDINPYDTDENRDIKRELNYEIPFHIADMVLHTAFERHIGCPTEFARSLYISEEMIADMAARGMTFGGHTTNHRVLSRLTPEQQHKELQPGITRLHTLTAQSSMPFCYPYGHDHTYTRDTLMLLEQLGYTTAFTTTRERMVWDRRRCYELPRVNTKDLPPFIQGLPPFLKECSYA
jgi:peptidoglycan/xylan/chitin deacetylase (PgdA/CDA1 family)